MTAILDLPLSIITDYIIHAVEKEKDQLAWELWTSVYPNMVLGYIKFKDFTSFKTDLLKKPLQYSHKTPEEIENELLDVIAAYERR